MGLEDLLYGSKTIRDFLKLFSEQNWNRVSKATMILGIQYLKHLTNNDLRQVSPKDIEDLIVRNQHYGLTLPDTKHSQNHKKQNGLIQDEKKKKMHKKKHNQNKNQNSQYETSEYTGQSSQSSVIPPTNQRLTTKQSERRNSPIIEKKNERKQNQRPQTTNVVEGNLKNKQKSFIEGQVIGKASSQWRRGVSQKPERISRFQHDKQDIQPRSASLNPMIYPSWWGEDEDNKNRRSRSTGRKRKEDSLDRKLRQAEKLRKRKEQDQRSPAHPTQTFYHQQTQQTYASNPRLDSSPSYAYTSSKYAPKYSPARNVNPNANNIPMSYVGPPSSQEINRNKGRILHNNGYDNNRQVQKKSQRKDDEGFSKGGGLVLSYSPPKQRKFGPAETTKQTKKNSRNQLPQKAKTNMTYQRPATAETKIVPKHLQNVQSKVKDQIEYHKRKFKQQMNSQHFSKDPQILYKVAEPHYDPNRVQGTGAALRRKPSPTKEGAEYQQHYVQEIDQTEQFSLRNTHGQWPSSIENINNSNQRSTNQNFYNQRSRPHHIEPSGNVGEITQGLIQSPIMSQFSESTPDKSIHPVSEHHAHRQGTRQPPLNQNYQMPPTNNDSNDQVIMFRSDGFEQSRYYQQNPNQSRFSKHPFQGGQPQVTSSGEMNNSSLYPSYVQTLDQTRTANPFSKNQNQSGITQGQSSRGDNQWVGNYIVGDEKRQEQRNLHDLAQSNSYTYTLQKPIDQPRRNEKKLQTFQYQEGGDQSDQDSEDSELSNYSPNNEMKGVLQQHYQDQYSQPNIIQVNQRQQQVDYQQQRGPYQYQQQQQQIPSTRLQGVDISKRHHQQQNDLNINENNSDSEFSSNSDYTEEEENEGSQSSSNVGSSHSSTSSYQQEMHPATAASGFYRGERAYQHQIQNQTHY